MTKSDKPKKKPKFIKPPNNLKTKVGSGGFDEVLVAKSQKHIENPEGDFLPYAQKFLADFSALIKDAGKSHEAFIMLRDKLTRPVMQLKASGRMFQYPLISEVANSALQFLEDLPPEQSNSEIFDVLNAHESALKMIVAGNMKGHRPEGVGLVTELEKACKRYFAKHAKLA